MIDVVFPDVTIELIKDAVQACSRYVGTLEDKFLERAARRYKNGYPSIGYLGAGRSGKDTAAQCVADHSELVYGGSTSNAVLPMIAHSLQLSEDEAWRTRHENRQFWFNWCNLYRQIYGQDSIAKLLLGLGDFVVGLRSKAEVCMVNEHGLVTHWVWISRAGANSDPTVEFDWPFVQHYGALHIRNSGGLDSYYEDVLRHASMAGVYIKKD